MASIWTSITSTIWSVLAKLAEIAACPQRCRECIDRFVLRKAAEITNAASPTRVVVHSINAPHTQSARDTEERYLLSCAAASTHTANMTASGHAMQDIVETVFSKVFSKKRDDDTSTDESSPEAAMNEPARPAIAHSTQMAVITNVRNPMGNASDSNESSDSVFDDELTGPHIVRPVISDSWLISCNCPECLRIPHTYLLISNHQ